MSRPSRSPARVPAVCAIVALAHALAVGAEPGDVRGVVGDHVNVRARPGLESEVLFQVDSARIAVELSREGDWIEVGIDGYCALGWIHASLLTAPDETDHGPARIEDRPVPPQ